MLSFLNVYITNIIIQTGYLGVFILMFIESCLIPVPSEAIMVFAGQAVSQGALSFWMVVTIGALGNLSGSVACYYIGKHIGEDRIEKFISRFGKFILVDIEDYRKAKNWTLRYGNFVSFFSRLLPGIRTVISLPCGVVGLDLKKFCFFTFTGSFIWSTFLTYIGVIFGENWETINPYFKKFDYLIILLLVLVAGIYIYHKLSKKKHIS